MSKGRTWPNRGVLVSAQEVDGAAIRIALDDLTLANEKAGSWDASCFVTSKDYDITQFEQLDFNEKELADFGYYILCRLYAFRKRGET